MAEATRIPVTTLYAVEVSGACNLEDKCNWCPMHNRPRSRKRGLMSPEVVKKSLEWAEKLEKVDALALHNFGEPLLHPKFDEIALEFSRVTPITMSTNGVLLTEEWADRLAKIPWAWISVSPWDSKAQKRAVSLLAERGISYCRPPGITHTWAGQVPGPTGVIFNHCHFLRDGKVVIRWDGKLTTCCITDRLEDSIGTVFQDPSEISLRPYSLCETCHHAKDG